MIACPAPQPVARTAPRSLRLPRTFSFLLLSWAAGALLGAPLYPDRGRRSELLKPCDEHYDRGRRGQAAGCYRELIGRSADPGRRRPKRSGRLGDLKSANERFRDAVNASPDDPDLRVRWGYLYVQSHQEGEAAKLFAEALERDKNHVAAKLGAASVMAGRFEGEALERVNEGARSQAGASGYLLLARMALEEGDLEKAEKSLRTALEKVESLQASPLETYALLASLDLLRQNPDSEWIDKALAHNPAFGKILCRASALLRHYAALPPGDGALAEGGRSRPHALAGARRPGRQPHARGTRRGRPPAPRNCL